ncbi:MAG: hypothetical protein LBI42_06235 [Chitinispirillales bacterium]|jgi:hypothetical protein|nr:hypothetical protein [Chitinispirillales bacterium]
MKNKIIHALGEDKLEHEENIIYSQIHVIDLRRRTKNRQGIKICDEKPEGTDTLLIENPNMLNISATVFKPQCFIDKDGKELPNCEGVFYLTNSTDKTWVLFFEIKDSKASRCSNYIKKTKEQIITVVKIFRDKNIITQNKIVYANISFPRRTKTDYSMKLNFKENPKQFIDKYKIHFLGTNTLLIKSDTEIDNLSSTKIADENHVIF